jgi:hypothetical protein
MVYETVVIATDKYDRQYTHEYFVEGPKQFSHFVADLHAQYQGLVQKGLYKAYSVICWEEEL